MFNKLKQYKDLRSQAKMMRQALGQETITAEKGGIKVVMSGNLEVISIKLNPDLAQESQEGMLADVLNETIKKAQRVMAEKIQGMGGLPKI